MSTPGDPNYSPSNYGGQPGSGDPYAAGPPGYPGQGGQSGYPGPASYPGAYPGGSGLPAAPVRPNTVTYAFGCWMASIVISLVGLILTLTSPIWDRAIAAGLQNSGNVTIDVQSLVNAVKIISIVAFLIFAGVYLLFAFKMLAGRNWARIVLTVFGALSVLSSFTNTTRSVTVNSQVFEVDSGQWASYLTVALAVAGIVLMYLAPSSKYFTASRSYRQQIKR